MREIARRAAQRYRVRAENCYRLARECPESLGMEIMTRLGNELVAKAQRLEQHAGRPRA
jgi:hypothetical protein